ncbi:hypothetical protein CD110_04085 [Staphylococcus casei]|uniref:hypothetical protein n=1 Tax=Staphylococcus casei TaxID=201828 RepID=UPI000CD21866|nr:hypothetical protein [Staphylococcus casei]PNZ60957.1 hypothetical protein CD110_04085 [Staphylococcus casei]WJE87447.1 hypothetical protein QMO72_05770 [Staphylococcus casei]
MEKLENYTDEQLIEDLKRISGDTKEAIDKKDFDKAMMVKEEVHGKWGYLNKVRFSNTGSQTFKTYRDALQEASAKSRGRWYENTRNPAASYLNKLDEIRIEIGHRLTFLDK